MTEEKDQDLFPIRKLSELTGANSVTLRAWERRYGLLKPKRTPKGHRLYDQADVEFVNAILVFLRENISISQVKTLVKSGVDIVAQVKNKTTELGQEEAVDAWQQYQDRVKRYLAEHKIRSLNGLLNEVFSLYPIDVIKQRLLDPLLMQSQREHYCLLEMINQRLSQNIQNREDKLKHYDILVFSESSAYSKFAALLFAYYAAQLEHGCLFMGERLASLHMVLQAKEHAANSLIVVNLASSLFKHELLELAALNQGHYRLLFLLPEEVNPKVIDLIQQENFIIMPDNDAMAFLQECLLGDS